MKKFTVVMFIILALLIVFISCTGDSDEDPAAEPEATEEAEVINIDSPEALVLSVTGENTNHGEGEYENPIIDINTEEETLNLILIGNDNLSSDYIRLGMLKDSCEIYKQVFDLFPDINRTYIEWQFPLVDSYGNEQLGAIMKVEMSKETEAKINWENFLTENLSDVADFYWHHNAIN